LVGLPAAQARLRPPAWPGSAQVNGKGGERLGLGPRPPPPGNRLRLPLDAPPIPLGQIATAPPRSAEHRAECRRHCRRRRVTPPRGSCAAGGHRAERRRCQRAPPRPALLPSAGGTTGLSSPHPNRRFGPASRSWLGGVPRPVIRGGHVAEGADGRGYHRRGGEFGG